MEFLLSQAWFPQRIKENYLCFLYGGNLDFKYKVPRREKWERKVLPATLPMRRKCILISSLMQYALLNI